ncbi:MAG TPA: pyridoxamine 5'-phosphate oxidase family protein [Herpetosiphonaceae bacterium]
MKVASFAEIEAPFLERVHIMVWCSMATLDTRNRPRSRILHPIWEDSLGWIATRRHSLKARHLAHSPYVSLAYIADIAKPVYVDCYAEWDESPDAKQHVWDLFLHAPPPLGYDPAPIFKSVDHPDYGVLKLRPWRIELYNFPQENLIWQPVEA